jgi:hypothetical protein
LSRFLPRQGGISSLRSSTFAPATKTGKCLGIYPDPRHSLRSHGAGAPLQSIKPVTRDKYMARIQLCTVTLVMLNWLYIRTAKTTPYLPCTVTPPAGGLAKVPGLCPVLRQVTRPRGPVPQAERGCSSLLSDGTGWLLR